MSSAWKLFSTFSLFIYFILFIVVLIFSLRDPDERVCAAQNIRHSVTESIVDEIEDSCCFCSRDAIRSLHDRNGRVEGWPVF